MGARGYLIIASYAAALLMGWTAHVWYAAWQREGEQSNIIETRISEETASNADAAKTVAKEAENDRKAKESDAALDAAIEKRRDDYRCPVPPDSVHALQQAVTSHARTRKPGGAMP